jgi:catechol 1,2-dioxygenase
VLDLQGRPVRGALLDVWQAGSNGLYDSQDREVDGLHMRGKYRTDADGRYVVRTVRPIHYQIPSDGPVGQMLKATNRHPWRPAHIHFVVSADGYESLTTHIFDDVDEYLKSDAVFAVQFQLAPPFCTTSFDFVLTPVPA